MQAKTTMAVVMIALGLAGCNRSTNALNVDTRPPAPLPSVPSGSIQSSQLDPLTGQPTGVTSAQQLPGVVNQQPLPGSAQPIESSELASLEPGTTAPQPTTPSVEPLSHEPLAGSWNVNSDSPDCRMILAFTKWSGGYRAATRRCQSPEISSITAWDVQSNKVVLVNSAGDVVANLFASGENRYDGTTSTGRPISFSR